MIFFFLKPEEASSHMTQLVCILDAMYSSLYLHKTLLIKAFHITVKIKALNNSLKKKKSETKILSHYRLMSGNVKSLHTGE